MGSGCTTRAQMATSRRSCSRTGLRTPVLLDAGGGGAGSEYDAVMVDARGHGDSDAPERGYGPVEQAEDLAGVIAALELRAAGGNSMGAATALVLAGAYPDLAGAFFSRTHRGVDWWSDTPAALASARSPCESGHLKN